MRKIQRKTVTPGCRSNVLDTTQKYKQWKKKIDKLDNQNFKQSQWKKTGQVGDRMGENTCPYISGKGFVS